MRHCFAFLLAALSVLAAADVERGAPLPRKGYFGAATAADSQGVKVTRVVAGGAAEACGLKNGDVIESVNGKEVRDVPGFVALIGLVKGGDSLDVRFLRDGKESNAKAKMTEYPRQVEANLDVVYDQVVSMGKRIRVIVTKPKGDGKFPTLFLIGGIGGYSVDASFSAMPYGNVLGPIANAGYVTVRIDKPGQGDSEGPAYKDLAFKVEQDAYLQALRLAKTLPYVDPNRIAIYGHSMGGCFAPLVASAEPVKAVIVNGTLFKSLTEYMLENTRRQSELGGAPEDQLDQDQKLLDAVMHFVFDENETPDQVGRLHPELAAFAKQTFPDGETYSGVGIPFFRELSHINLPGAWSKTKSDVLALYGENDFLSGRDDHERIATYVNKLRPGTAQFILMPNCDHVFTKTTSMRDSMDKWGKGGEFNPIIVQTLLDYLKKELG
ncbi:MAG TPA: alpha/beta fold hydrolase [Fimbriimonadaceae bacterium]|nr:alpha/beta fold hydrolase [Fimbriimonadaceae bacterium]